MGISRNAAVLVLVLVVALAQKEDELHGWGQKPNPHAYRQPTYTSNELYCNACQGMVREVLVKLRHRSAESDVVEAMTDICDMWQYAKYEFPPPEFKKGCESLIGDFEEEFEYTFVNRFNDDLDPEERICHEITGACINIDVEFHPPEDEPDPEEEELERIYQEEKRLREEARAKRKAEKEAMEGKKDL